MSKRLDRYFWTLTMEERERYAARIGTSYVSLRNHYFGRDEAGRGRPRVVPSVKRVCALADASQGQVSRMSAFSYFTAGLAA